MTTDSSSKGVAQATRPPTPLSAAIHVPLCKELLCKAQEQKEKTGGSNLHFLFSVWKGLSIMRKAWGSLIIILSQVLFLTPFCESPFVFCSHRWISVWFIQDTHADRSCRQGTLRCSQRGTDSHCQVKGSPHLSCTNGKATAVCLNYRQK